MTVSLQSGRNIMDILVGWLPVALQAKAKAIIAAIGMLLSIIVAIVPAFPSWGFAIIAAITALGVYQTPNLGYTPPALSGE